jgi:FkbM family methyltransferase
MIKQFLRELLLFFGLDLTKNLKYDRLSRKFIRQYVREGDNCIDVGAHRGEILHFLIEQAQLGKHLAFEPIPEFYEKLQLTFGKTAQILPFALSNERGKRTFQWVKNAPAYSGFEKRKYPHRLPNIETIEVETRTLDEFQHKEIPIRFVKIDVEGAEFLVLKGAKQTLKTHRPFILFEFGLGASDYYQSSEKELFAFFSELDYVLFTLGDFFAKKPPMALHEFENHYKKNTEYYFLAFPK